MKKANCNLAYFCYSVRMKTLEITDANTRINESCHIIDRGLVDIANIVIGEGLQVEYCFVMSHSKPPCHGGNRNIRCSFLP
jgi:hypothetical protein